MRRWALLLILAGMATPALAAKTLSMEQMEQFLAKLHGKPDGKVAGELDEVQLTERVSLTRLERWEADFPGSRTHEALIKLADMSAFLNPPGSDVIPDPAPDTETQQRMLWLAVQYVRTTISRLPDFFATRETMHFEDTLSQHMGYSAGSSSSGIDEHQPLSALSIKPVGVAANTVFKALHSTGVYSRTVTYRDGREIPFEDAGKRGKEPALGLTTSGEFGPILGAVIDDVIQSGVSWLRWEQGASEPAAVFHYAVAQDESHFRVGITNGDKVQTLYPAYHGEIEIDPATGEILRLSEVADMTPPHEAMRAAVMVEYAPVTIGDRSYVCPVRGVAFSRMPVPSAGSTAPDSWPVQTELNDVAFTHYHLFRSEARIVANANGNGGANAAGGSQAPEAEASTGGASASMPASPGAPGSSSAPTAEEATAPVADTGSKQSVEPAAGAGAKPPLSPAAGAAMTPVAISAPTRAAEHAEARAAQPAPAGATKGALATGTVLHAKSKLVLVDVVVTDHDRPVQRLDRDRFHVFEGGREQPIASFEEYEPASKVTVAEPPTLPRNTYSNVATYPETGAVNVLLLDALNTPASDQERVRRAMIGYLGTIKPGTSMVVFTLSSQLRMAVGFTTDIRQLLKVLESQEAKPQTAAGVGSGRGSNMTTDLEQAASGINTSSDPGTIWLVTNIMQFAADMKTYDTDQRETMTLEAFSELARYLAAIPGRKNVIWFSGSFPIGLWPDRNLMTPTKDIGDYSSEVQRTGELLAAARVAVYPVDARGLMTAPTADATQIPPPAFPQPGEPGPTAAAVNRDDASSAVQTSQEQGSLNTIAAETGGHVYSTGNDLKAAVEKIMANDSYYYALSYVPPEAKEGKNGAEFHTIEVKVDGGKYQLAYRRGYYTGDAGNLTTASGGMPVPMTEAAELGGPPATQILFQARVLPVSDPSFSGVALDDKVAGEKSASFPGGARRYVVDLSVKPQDLTFAEGADGAGRTQLECALVAYDGEGKEVNSLGRRFDFHLPAEQYERLRTAGSEVPVRLALDLPAGELTLRIVVYDPASARTGSLEIPIQVAGK